MSPMAAGSPERAKRALVKVLLTIAAVYSVRLTLTRDSSDEDCIKAFRRVSLRAHPDKGGLLAHSQAINSAKDAWDKLRHNKSGRPRGSAQKRGATDLSTSQAQRADKKKGLRIQSLGVLLTYCGVRDQAQWQNFVAHVRAKLSLWEVKYWCATCLLYTSPSPRDATLSRMPSSA